MAKNKNKIWLIIAVIVLIIIILIYFASLGTVNLADRKPSEEDEKAKRKRWIDERLNDLRYRAESKKALKEKLDHKVKKYFLYTRIALVFIFLGLNAFFYFFVLGFDKGFDDKISVLLNYNQLGLILILVAMFIRFETSSEFRDVFRLIHLFIIQIIYKNHPGLDSELAVIHSEIEELQKELDDIDKEEKK